jgi:BioD-like phosphotransacetylase family protein
VNTQTPRLFIAATRQDEGKTTTCLGLHHALAPIFGRVGYIKPVGQRYVEVDGKRVDEDTVLIDRVCQMDTPIEAMSPITVDADFTRRFIQEGNLLELEQKLIKSFDRAAWEKDCILIEGSGHAGVGSIFGLSNARVSRILHSRAIIVTRGGIGAPVDEVAQGLALFEKHGVQVAGVILNKVLPAKLDSVREYAGRALRGLGVPLLGVIPKEESLTEPAFSQVVEEVGGRWVHGEEHGRRRIKGVVIGTMSSSNVARCLKPGSLLVVPGDRGGLIWAALRHAARPAGRADLAGIIFCDGSAPDAGTMELLEKSNVPAAASSKDAFGVAVAMRSLTVKTDSSDEDKISTIQKMVAKHVDVAAVARLARNGVNNSGRRMS